MLSFFSFQRGNDRELRKGNREDMAGYTFKNSDKVEVSILGKESFFAEMCE
jgi:hypothetical protein